MNEPLRDARDAIVLQALVEGLTAAQIRERYGYDKSTLWRSFNRLKSAMAEGFDGSMQEYRERQLAELQDLRDVLTDPLMRPEKKVELALKIISLESELVGSRAPTRTISARVDMTADEVNPTVVGLSACPTCGGGLDPNGKPQPMSCVHEFIDPPVGEQTTLPPSYPVPLLGLPEGGDE